MYICAYILSYIIINKYFNKQRKKMNLNFKKSIKKIYYYYNYSTSVKNGPNLKHFLNKTLLNINDDINNNNNKATDDDEIITNRLLKNTHNNLLDDDYNDHLEQTKRKVFFEVHGCQMNTNDTEVALAILNKTGLYEKINDEKDADVVLISIIYYFLPLYS